jgi:hypothetical protein
MDPCPIGSLASEYDMQRTGEEEEEDAGEGEQLHGGHFDPSISMLCSCCLFIDGLYREDGNAKLPAWLAETDRGRLR